MRKKMRERILQERWQAQQAELSFSCKQVELSPLPGEAAEGSFTVSCTEGMTAEGFIRADDERITCLVPWFSGSQETIAFRFDAQGMQEGEVREGFFFITSDCGEYRLPYLIRIGEKVLTSSMGEIRNLFHFTNLARASWQEAVQLFYRTDFIYIFDREGEALRSLYRGFSAEEGNEFNVEQFLVAVRKKQPVTYSSTQTEIRMKDLNGKVREETVITKNGWGAAGLRIEVLGAFLSVEKNHLTEDSFLGNQCRVPVFFEESALHAGRNFGQLRFVWPGGSFCINITVEQHNIRLRADDKRRREIRQCNLQIVRLYEQLRMKKIDMPKWQKEASECVERLAHLMERSAVPKLLKAHLLITQEKMEEAGWILDHVESYLDDAAPAVQCYYLYLNTLYVRKESCVLEAEKKVKEIFAQNPGEWRIAWLLLFLSKDLNRSASRKWQFLEECFAQGCISPVLYLEALQLFNVNPTLLLGLDGAVLRILYYGAKKRFLSRDLVGQILYLTGKEKYFHPQLFDILRMCYEARPDTDTLQAICALLIKGGKTGTEFHSWYLKGVQEKLRITRLYEYYMMSLDLDQDVEIPRIVLFYFAYQSNLDYEYAAYLYAYVERNMHDDAELYAAYRTQIERFVETQLQKGRINRHLAYLYEQIVQGPMLTKENAAALAALLPKAEVKWQGEKRSLIAVHARLKGEERYAFSKQTAVIDLYSDSDLLFLQDEYGSRYPADSCVKVRRLFTGETLKKRVESYAQLSTGLSLSCVDEDGIHINEENEADYLAVVQHPALEEEYGQKVRIALLRFYFEQDKGAELDGLLEKLEKEQISSTDRAEAVRLLVLRSFYQKAYEWIDGTDLKKQDARILMRLGSRLLEAGIGEEDARMTMLCAKAAIHGKYDERILKQLTENYEGDTKELEAVLQAAEGFEIETFALCERLIEQLLYTGADVTERMDLLRQYVRGGGSNKVICAFLHRCACRYVMQDEPIHIYMIQMIGQMLRRKETVSDMCKIAYLEYYARNRAARSTETDRYLEQIGERMYKDGKLLPVLREYTDILPQAAYLEDKSFVVYRGQKQEAVWIHYRPVQENDAGGDYSSMPMRHIYGSIYAAEFLLFAGETLQYYITGESQDAGILEHGFLKPPALGDASNNSRYAQLSAVTARQLEKRDGSSAVLLKGYLHTDFLTAQLFKPLV